MHKKYSNNIYLVILPKHICIRNIIIAFIKKLFVVMPFFFLEMGI